jgi:uracil-DNA glycosylase family 4
MDLIQLLYDLSDEILVCPKCRLADTRTYAVPGEGNPTAQIMFVGEGPGEQEDLSGRPFVGKSGQLLTRELAKIGITRDMVFITNIVKCRPPGNRVPLVDEIEACSDWLMAQIALINPKFIVPVGGPSLQTLVSKQLKITASRSRVFRKEGILFIPILHPSAALRSAPMMDLFLQDLNNLSDYLDREIEEGEITDITPPIPRSVEQTAEHNVEVKEDGGTLSLF